MSMTNTEFAHARYEKAVHDNCRLRKLLREGVAGTAAILKLDMEATEIRDAICSDAEDWMGRVRKELGE